ncbi:MULTISPECIES: ribonuclease T [unclassified Legionella]|uniref:ribonuclease T2 family protein n=1 Tax=unclassified Legionella TaxID=2622702 RepID=UPI0010563E0D|nr:MULTISPECIES: ribonuclease T [unclassified Legionella]MDI9819653.1 ribonuclease T [Legionella sp. PL877]
MIKLVAFLLILISFCAYPSITVIGSFEANKSCPAYLSKNKKTNPDKLIIKPAEKYEIREINRAENPDWLRIEVPTGENSLRWISAACGEYSYQANGKNACEQIPGLADSYVLALSWQPGFCQTYGYEAGKPECRNLATDSYQASYLVLHGFWPNQQICGQQYGFCGVKPQENHCDYPPVNLNEDVARNLRQLMPSYAFGSCLERHEWNKHGSCQMLSTDDYFTLAMRLNQEANQTALGQFIHRHAGDIVSADKLRESIRQSFGKDASHKVYLGCKNGMLVDVFIQLPALIPANETLTALVGKAPEFTRYDACPGRIAISDFNSDSWF